MLVTAGLTASASVIAASLLAAQTGAEGDTPDGPFSTGQYGDPT